MAVLLIGISLAGCVTKRDIEEVKDQLTRVESQNRESSRLMAKVDSLIERSANDSERLRADIRTSVDNMQSQIDALLENYNQLQIQLNQINQKLDQPARRLIGSQPGDTVYQQPGQGMTTPTTPSTPPPSIVTPAINCDSTYDKAFIEVRQQAYEEAIEGFQNFLAECPNHEKVADSYFWIGECFFRQDNFGRAISEFEHLVNTYKDSPKVVSALYKVGRSQQELGRTDDARTTFQKVIDDFPSSTEASQAKERLADL